MNSEQRGAIPVLDSICSNLLEQILETGSRAVAVIQTDHTILRANRTYADFFKQDYKHLPGRRCYEVAPHSICRTPGCHLRQVLECGKVVDGEYQKLDSDGCHVHCRVVSSPLRSPEGGMVGMIQEISDIEETSLLRYNLDLKSRRLEIQEKRLHELEVALKQMVRQVGYEKRRTEKQIADSIDRLVIPLLHHARSQVNTETSSTLELAENSLQELVSPLVDSKDRSMARLSSRELEICHLIRRGLQTKDIARLFNTSPGTVEQQRKRIRRKLDLKGSGRNLTTYLQAK